MYIDKLDDTLNEDKHTYNRAIKMKPVDVSSNRYIDFGIENFAKYPKF